MTLSLKKSSTLDKSSSNYHDIINSKELFEKDAEILDQINKDVFRWAIFDHESKLDYQILIIQFWSSSKVFDGRPDELFLIIAEPEQRSTSSVPLSPHLILPLIT